MGTKKESFHLLGKTNDTNYLFKSMKRGNANAEAQFFRMSSGTPSVSRLLLLSNFNNASSISKTLN
jgi:hypothetical protein